jgi:hypothetical protein
MGTLWFWLVALMIAAYVLLDGFDLGAGAVHLFVAKTDEERKQVIASIGSVWNGNEVWLIATGGTLYFAFPALYASGFSGFYLPLMIVLWLLILRGISIEFRDHIRSAVWDPFWDFLFCASSLLLCVFFGAALGNVVRGVPLDASGYFFEPLWTNFRLGERIGILDWYTILVGLLALAALVVHGALWVVLKTTGPVRDRSVELVGGGRADGRSDHRKFSRSTGDRASFSERALGLRVPAHRHLGLGWHPLGDGSRRRMEELSRCRMLFDGNASQRSLWDFPHRAPGAQFGIFVDC